MSKKLRLLLDECVPVPLAREIERCAGVSSIEIINGDHDLGNRNVPDQDVVAYATRENRILVTTEGRLNEKEYTICTHPGIIVIHATRRHEVEKARLFTRFMRSGHRAGSAHAVTKLRLGQSERLERGPDGQVRSVPLDIT